VKFPDLVGQELDKGLAILKHHHGSLNIVINEYTIPDDFHKKAKNFGTKRIVRQKIVPGKSIELVVFNFNERPNSPL
jgi:hypothetical protein